MSNGSSAWVRTLQRWFGYCLTPDISLEKLLWMQGPGGTGKGTIVEALTSVLGDENVAATTLDAISKDVGGISDLVGRHVAVISELHVSGFTTVAAALTTLKAASGGDKMRVRDLHRPAVHVRLSCKWVLTPNETPRLPDASNALSRRIIALPMGSPPRKPDPGLKARLRTEEREGLALWAVFGLIDLRRAMQRGEAPFPQPAEGLWIIDELERAASPIAPFIRDHCIVGEGHACQTELLYQAYQQACEEDGARPVSKEQFGRHLRSALPGLKREKERNPEGGMPWFYRGIRPRIEKDGDGAPPRTLRWRDANGGWWEEWGQSQSVFPT